jgi:RNase P subunit RPR2
MYLFIFLILIITATVVSFILFAREKREKLKMIENRICPNCHKMAIELVDQRGGGCSSAKMVTFECRECKYSIVYNLNSSCSSSSCNI